ncbi:MAG: undecaprenyl-diphosphatase UppP [Acidobacteria bacterium]|mgnify:CR=1 FL=1|nr:MAG: undecaprenyl-diphosphatase UppP [Acidobacteriota bacterium]REK01385.1 MAG: undecaprenyl-diphosphatase UppP [Acidobacteriota bacterium]REK14341.1 MAG: undecaprenyl-diphosphatase UppP [Acidobacteriota bacterium]REK45056.1 MAG: undecaprenyl-diphosphatase UppP [Acidobacteriota bacterium]
MDLLQAIILGIVQGLTEFIPVSSTAHLVFASRYTGIYGGNPEQITATMAVIQLGTLAAVFVYFAQDIWSISTAFVRDHFALLRGQRVELEGANKKRPRWLSDESWLGWMIVVGSVPVAIFGLVFKETIEGALTKDLWIIATMLIVVAVMLQIAEYVGRQRKGIKELGAGEALLVGAAQVLALMPGASRSGSTIMGGLFAGLSREAAARFSFLLMIPAISASGLLELVEAWHILPNDSFLPLFAGTIAAGIVGYLSIWFLLAYLRRYTTTVFVIYRILLGAAILFMLWQGIITARV